MVAPSRRVVERDGRIRHCRLTNETPSFPIHRSHTALVTALMLNHSIVAESQCISGTCVTALLSTVERYMPVVRGGEAKSHPRFGAPRTGIGRRILAVASCCDQKPSPAPASNLRCRTLRADRSQWLSPDSQLGHDQTIRYSPNLSFLYTLPCKGRCRRRLTGSLLGSVPPP